MIRSLLDRSGINLEEDGLALDEEGGGAEFKDFLGAKGGVLSTWNHWMSFGRC
jgi:hypothetical protein